MVWLRIESTEKISAGRSRFLVDENSDACVVDYLRKRKFNVKTTAERNLRHRDDADIMAVAWAEDRILLTHDAGFVDEHRYPPCLLYTSDAADE